MRFLAKIRNTIIALNSAPFAIIKWGKLKIKTLSVKLLNAVDSKTTYISVLYCEDKWPHRGTQIFITILPFHVNLELTQ